jgi:hypothetical protein
MLTEVLISAPCQRIDVRFGAARVMGAHFSALAISLNGATPHRLREEVGPTAGAGASYRVHPNRIRAPTGNFGVGTGAYAGEERMSLVHEATHAVLDFQRQNVLTALEQEMVAYVAGALYNRYAGLPYTNASDALWVAADRVAAGVAAQPGAMVPPSGDAAALRAAILADPTYVHLRRNPGLRWRNDGIAL